MVEMSLQGSEIVLRSGEHLTLSLTSPRTSGWELTQLGSGFRQDLNPDYSLHVWLTLLSTLHSLHLCSEHSYLCNENT